MPNTTTPVAISYTSRDYAAFRESMLAHAQTVAPEWRGAAVGDPNDLGVALVELFAYEGDVLSYYADRIANEAFLSTATQRSSVLEHAHLLGYKPRSATAATVEVEFTVTTGANEVTLPAGFQVSTTPDDGFDPLVYELQTDLTIPANTTDGTFTVTAQEGLTVEDEVLGTSCGDLDATFTLAQTPVVVDSVVIRVVERPDDPGQVWFPVNNLLNVGASDNAYSYRLGEADSLTIQFGDGINGRVPPRGAVIHARYRVGGGADGNVQDGTIDQIVDPNDIYMPPGTQEPPILAVTNPEAASGGTDSESLDSIRENVPRSVRASDRAVSLADYEALALTVPQVQIAKAKAVGQVYTNITIFIAPPGGAQPSQTMLAAVVDYFDSRKMVGVSVVAATPQYVGIDVELEVIVDDRYNQALVRQLVTNAMNELFSFDAVNFGGRVPLADIYSTAQAVEGVRNVVVSKLARSGGTGASDIVLRDNELPTAGAFVLRATGGIVNSGAATSTGGSGTPTASGAPTIDLLRCDPNSTHVELSWTVGADTTAWDIVVAYLNSSNVVVQTVVAGPYSTPSAVIDLPLIGAGRATSVSFSTRAYNGTVGPVVSPVTTTTYLCD